MPVQASSRKTTGRLSLCLRVGFGLGAGECGRDRVGMGFMHRPHLSPLTTDIWDKLGIPSNEYVSLARSIARSLGLRGPTAIFVFCGPSRTGPLHGADLDGLLSPAHDLVGADV